MEKHGRHIQARVEPELYNAVKILALKRGITMQQIIEDMIRNHVALVNKDSSALAAAGYEDGRINMFVEFLQTASPVMKQSVLGIIEGVLKQTTQI